MIYLAAGELCETFGRLIRVVTALELEDVCLAFFCSSDRSLALAILRQGLAHEEEGGECIGKIHYGCFDFKEKYCGQCTTLQLKSNESSNIALWE
jgi:hypothetical protein